MSGHQACPKCGASMSGDSKTCNSCGSVNLPRLTCILEPREMDIPSERTSEWDAVADCLTMLTTLNE
ncbi:hypothetical protein BDV59DRAFT_200469 [Aspergillus ambiguus]|uniref:uncharacterized protein n=1 Tax=Aspergillus ambiguus TaxID=176160 RepID=UPI003CCE4211